MNNKKLIMSGLFLLVLPVHGFANEIQGPPSPDLSVQEGTNEKAIFDHHEAIYNNKANTQIRSQELVEKDVDAEQVEKKKVEDAQDRTKGQVLMKF